MLRPLALLACLATGCAVAAGVEVIPAGITAAYLAGDVRPGDGTTGDAAGKRLTARARDARVASAHDAVAAAVAAPGDVRLQRRAAAMVWLAGRDAGIDAHDIDRVLEADVAASACTGLADTGATRAALGDNARAGDAYVREARECTSFEAAVAAAAPLRAADRCKDEVALVREMWPKLDHPKAGVAVGLLDAVGSCSDSISLRANLDFVQPQVVDDYMALLHHRARVAAARMAASQCRSECEAAQSSCGGYDFCGSIYHSCAADCGGAP